MTLSWLLLLVVVLLAQLMADENGRHPSSLLCGGVMAASLVPSTQNHLLDRRRRLPWLFVARGGSGATNQVLDGPPTTTTTTTKTASPQKEDVDNSNSTGDTLYNASTTTTIDSNVTTSTTAMPNPVIPAWKRALPEPLHCKGPKTLQKIRLGNANSAVEIYLLGTAHVSNDSSADVRTLLEATRPDCIFVELCEARMTLLEGNNEEEEEEEQQQQQQKDTLSNGDTNGDMAHSNTTNNTTTTHNHTETELQTTETPKKQDFWDKLENIRQSQGGSRLQALSTLLLTSVQEDYAETLGVELGGEFRAAHLYWKRAQQESQQATASNANNNLPHPSLVLGDRPLTLTLVRAWESLWWWPKTKVLAGLLWSSWRKPNTDEIRAWLQSVLAEESDVLTESLQELRQHFPTLYETIIAERDAWLAAKLVQTSRVLMMQQDQQQERPPKRIVAIVGAGHVPGIVQWLTNPGQQKNNNDIAATTTAAGGPSTTYYGSSPEEILHNLTATRRWRGDSVVQQEMVPVWVHQVTQVQQNEDWSWSDPSTATPP